MQITLPYEPLFDEGQGDIMVLLENSFSPSNNWSPLIRQFTSTHRILVPRLPFCSYPASSERCNDLIEYLDHFLSVHTTKKVILAGNGVGGNLALLYAWHFPSKVKQLILITVPRLTETLFDERMPIAETEFLLEDISMDEPSPVKSKFYFDERSEVLHQFSFRKENRQGVAPSLTQIVAPVLIICGLQDNHTSPEEAFQYHDLLPFSKIVFFDRKSPSTTQAELFETHVRNFLK